MCIMTNSAYYLFVNTKLKVKTCLDKTRQLVTWQQVSLKYQVQSGFQAFSLEKKQD